MFLIQWLCSAATATSDGGRTSMVPNKLQGWNVFVRGGLWVAACTLSSNRLWETLLGGLNDWNIVGSDMSGWATMKKNTK